MQKIIRALRLNLDIFIPLVLLVPLYLILYKIYIPRVNAFGCFDDCFNYMGGYFLMQGKHIYSDFFYNHQPMAAYISYLIQTISHPQSIFELVLRHRQFILLFSFAMNIILISRFRLTAFLFTIIFELSKFYLFGDRFLSEGMIIYPLAYLTGLALLRLNYVRTSKSKNLIPIDYLLAPIFAWFAVFSREPYIPLALFLLAIILYSKKIQRVHIFSASLFLVLSALTIFTLDIKEYFFNVVTVNYTAIIPNDVDAAMPGPRILQILFYPIYILFFGDLNIFKQLLIFMDVVFLANFFILLKTKKLKIASLVFIILGLANIRVILPGTTFYAGFHMLIWYGLFIFTTASIVFLNHKFKTLFFASLFLISAGFLLFIGSKSYFVHDKVDQQAEFIEGFGSNLQEGEVIKALAKPGQTLFLDDSDDLIYWQSKVSSNYKYSWYTSAMPLFEKYADARTAMFQSNPPDFYREEGICPKKYVDHDPLRTLPSFVKDKYVQFYNLNQPSCLYIKKDIINGISKAQWQKANEFLYHLK